MTETTTQILGIGSRVNHPSDGQGVVIRLHKIAYEVCFISCGIKNIGKEYIKWDIIEAMPLDEEVSFSEAEKSLEKILQKWSGMTDTVELGDKWDNGTLILKPADSNLKPKEMPIDNFFHKIVMVRDRIRVMEQRINSSKLTDEEKINLQQYITRIYGSLTSFNILFKYKNDHFVGGRS
jgi:hypothetical protein